MPNLSLSKPIAYKSKAQITYSICFSLILALASSFVAYGQSTSQTQVANDQRLKAQEAAKVTGKPRIRLDVVQHFWKEMFQGSMYDVEWKVHNDGDQVLRISKIKVDCHCSTFEWDKEIAPGQSGTIKLHFNSNKIKPGNPSKEAEVFSNDPDFPLVKLWYGGPIVKVIRATPGQVKISGLITSGGKASITLSASTHRHFTIKKIDVHNKQVTASFTKVQGRPSTFRINLEKLPGEKVGKIVDYLKINLIMDEDKQSITPVIPVTIEHLAAINVTPKTTVLFKSKETGKILKNPNASVIKSVRVRGIDPKASFQVTDYKLNGLPEGLFEIKLVELRKDRDYHLEIKLLKYPKLSYAQGEVEFTLSNGSTHKVKIFAKFGGRR